MPSLNRRKFINVASMAAIPAILPVMEKEKNKYRIIHHVFFYLNNPGSRADIDLLIEGLKTLKAVPEVKELLIGKPARTGKRDVVDNTFDVSEMMYFKSAEEQDAYQVHPVHKAFVEKYSHLWKTVKVYDMEVLD
ncbi:MAG: Dabb family protein [Chitinophagaceae bacterium]|nr:MAG: Dabb family protein [Chitinophagaceae bacterium]